MQFPQFSSGHQALARLIGALLISSLMLSQGLAVPFYADALVDSMFVTSFGSGDVTGPPDGGGLFLGDTFDPPVNPGFLTVEFLTPAGNGSGFDFEVLDVASSTNETADVFVSSDGMAFSFVQSINAVANGVELGGAFAGPVRFLKIANSSTLVSIDIDAIRANYVYVPEPGSGITALIAIVCAAAQCCRRGRRADGQR